MCIPVFRERNFYFSASKNYDNYSYHIPWCINQVLKPDFLLLKFKCSHASALPHGEAVCQQALGKLNWAPESSGITGPTSNPHDWPQHCCQGGKDQAPHAAQGLPDFLIITDRIRVDSRNRSPFLLPSCHGLFFILDLCGSY